MDEKNGLKKLSTMKFHFYDISEKANMEDGDQGWSRGGDE
jgi:hypothetical protein